MGSPNGAATTSRCRVNLMGGFRMRSDDRVVELPLGAQRLVSYLALEGSWVARVHAAEMLWSDSRRRQAGANFARAPRFLGWWCQGWKATTLRTICEAR